MNLINFYTYIKRERKINKREIDVPMKTARISMKQIYKMSGKKLKVLINISKLGNRIFQTFFFIKIKLKNMIF